jgi:hypothetical protein
MEACHCPPRSRRMAVIQRTSSRPAPTWTSPLPPPTRRPSLPSSRRASLPRPMRANSTARRNPGSPNTACLPNSHGDFLSMSPMCLRSSCSSSFRLGRDLAQAFERKQGVDRQRVLAHGALVALACLSCAHPSSRKCAPSSTARGPRRRRCPRAGSASALGRASATPCRSRGRVGGRRRVATGPRAPCRPWGRCRPDRRATSRPRHPCCRRCRPRPRAGGRRRPGGGRDDPSRSARRARWPCPCRPPRRSERAPWYSERASRSRSPASRQSAMA